MPEADRKILRKMKRVQAESTEAVPEDLFGVDTIGLEDGEDADLANAVKAAAAAFLTKAASSGSRKVSWRVCCARVWPAGPTRWWRR